MKTLHLFHSVLLLQLQTLAKTVGINVVLRQDFVQNFAEVESVVGKVTLVMVVMATWAIQAVMFVHIQVRSTPLYLSISI